LNLKVGRTGTIALPKKLRLHYGMKANSPVRVVETRGGVLLVPITDAPMSAELERELAEWQTLGASTWDSFPYETDS
jgi:bifunctional DNA-binding transcriptional regulator/antitoxin component of YhaV-PrlF toxin-antitoxin module